MPSRRSVAAALAALSALVLAAPAGATKPDRVPLPSEDFTDSSFCGFPVSVELVRNKEKLTVFSDGDILISGAYAVRLTNVDDPSKSIVVNASGPIRTDEASTGGQLFFLGDPAEAFGTGIYLLHGNITVTRDDEGRIVDVQHTGSMSGNLCDLIA
jgi:hypothetical protein